jgi:hypothetical protein
MIGIVSLLVILVLSVLVTRIATVALMHTGLSKEVSRFQARSAYTGAGFTTSESERLVNHPVRRRIVMGLMLIGNAGIITAVSSLILTFVQQGEDRRLGPKVVILLTGLVVLWLISQSRLVDRYLSRIIDWALRRSPVIEVRDFAGLLGIGGDFEIAELQVQPKDWLANRTLREARLQDEGILLLAITRASGKFLGAPAPDTCIGPEDTLVLYGTRDQIEALDRRRENEAGDDEHEHAVAKRRREKRSTSGPTQ